MNNKNSIYYVSTINQTVPLSTIQTGTIETLDSAVVGTGTKFKTEMPAGSWLVDLTQNEIRKVKDVESDVLAYVDAPFTLDLAALTALNVILAKDAKCVSIALQVPAGGAAATLDGYPFPAGTSVAFSKDSRDHSAARDLVDPVIIDASGTSVQVLIQK
jgi:hypothetical protein